MCSVLWLNRGVPQSGPASLRCRIQNQQKPTNAVVLVGLTRRGLGLAKRPCFLRTTISLVETQIKSILAIGEI